MTTALQCQCFCLLVLNFPNDLCALVSDFDSTNELRGDYFLILKAQFIKNQLFRNAETLAVARPTLNAPSQSLRDSSPPPDGEGEPRD